MLIKTKVNGRVVVRVSELATMMGVCPSTIFNYIRRGLVETVLLNLRDRRIYLDTVVGKENVNRPFVDVGKASILLHLTKSRICHHIREGNFDYVAGPRGIYLIFVDSLTIPEFDGRELVTLKMAQKLTGFTEGKLVYLMDKGTIDFVRVPSGSRRIILETIPLSRATTTNEPVATTESTSV